MSPTGKSLAFDHSQQGVKDDDSRAWLDAQLVEGHLISG
jgi:hypothetical protein